MVSEEKGLEIHIFPKYPTASGGEFSARTADAIVAFDQSNNLCEMAITGRLRPGPSPDYRSRIGFAPTIYVVRGEAERTRLYALQFNTGRVAVDDIVLDAPEIIRVEQAPASDVIALEALWPMNRRGEMSVRVPALIEAYQRLPAGVNGCVEFITASMEFRTMTPAASRIRNTDFRDVPEWRHSAYCREELAGRIPQPSMSTLTPAGG